MLVAIPPNSSIVPEPSSFGILLAGGIPGNNAPTADSGRMSPLRRTAAIPMVADEGRLFVTVVVFSDGDGVMEGPECSLESTVPSSVASLSVAPVVNVVVIFRPSTAFSRLSLVAEEVTEGEAEGCREENGGEETEVEARQDPAAPSCLGRR